MAFFVWLYIVTDAIREGHHAPKISELEKENGKRCEQRHHDCDNFLHRPQAKWALLAVCKIYVRVADAIGIFQANVCLLKVCLKLAWPLRRRALPLLSLIEVKHCLAEDAEGRVCRVQRLQFRNSRVR